jgi:peptidoglycan hydrolase CwlO-like protein
MKTVKLETYNKVKVELDKANLQIKELTAIAEQRAKDVDGVCKKVDTLIGEYKKLENEVVESKKVAEVFKNKYRALNEAIKAMANANDNLLFKC